MIIRAIDGNGDWTFGKGKNNYKTGINALAQNIQTRLQSFLGDCFFDKTAGIDWFNLLGSKQRVELGLAINAVILNTEDVTGILEVSTNLNQNRLITSQYKVQTSLGTIDDIFQYDLNGLA